MARNSGQNARSLQSFGVVGLLDENCKIYYDSVFTPRHIGKISDLLVAKLKDTLPNELKFRVLLLLSLYEAYHQQCKFVQKTPGDALPEPLTIECGVDAEHIAIGLSFGLRAEELTALDKVAANVTSGSASNPIELLLAELGKDADHVVFRMNASAKKAEVVSLISLSEAAESQREIALDVISLEQAQTKESLKGEYIELGDLDYHRLLSDDSIQSNKLPKPATGEILAGKSELEASIKLRGQEHEDSSVIKIAGVTQNLSGDQSKISVAGQAPSTEGNTSTVVGGMTAAESKQVEFYQQKVDALQNKIRELEKERASSQTVISSQNLVSDSTITTVSGGDGSADGSSDRVTVKGNNLNLRDLLEKVWPFKKLVNDQIAPSAPEVAASAVKASEPVAQKAPEAQAPAPAPVPEKEEESAEASSDMTRKLVTEEIGAIERTIAKVQAEAQDIKKDIGNARAQKWVDGMVGELVTEKARIHEMAKKVNVSLRQKELEFRNKEHMLQEEIRKRDEQIRQKTHSHNRVRDQMAQLQIQLDRIKATAPAPGEESQARQKLNLSQKLLASAKEENIALTQKIEELKSQQLATAQTAAKTKTQSPEHAALKVKYESLFKQSEEFKRKNAQLMEKLAEAQRASKNPGTNPEELKKRLDVSMKLVATYQKESEQNKLRVEELQREEQRLKAELARAGNALLALKKATLAPKASSAPKAAPTSTVAAASASSTTSNSNSRSSSDSSGSGSGTGSDSGSNQAA